MQPITSEASSSSSAYRFEFVVASYNVHRAVGGDRRKQPLRIAETIAALDADLIALQEVETPADVAPRLFLQRLYEFGYEVVFGHTMLLGPHHYGNLLLSRLPVLCEQRLDISQPGREPRGLIDVEVAWRPSAVASAGASSAANMGAGTNAGAARMQAAGTNAGRAGTNAGRDAGAPVAHAALAKTSQGRLGETGDSGDTGTVALRCLATHLGLSAAERRRQIAAILTHLGEAESATSARIPLILMGDFNEWWPRNGRLALLNRRLHAAPALASFPSRWPLLALDRLWYSSALERIETEVVRTKATRAASDHLPLRARFRLQLGGI